ncbi:MAG: restriction endonuclease subunit S [archaeon]
MKNTVRLGDVVKKIEEKEFKPLEAGYERFVKVQHMDPENLRIQRWGSIRDDLFPPTFYKVFRKGQILFPTRNPHLRRAVLADFDGICGEKTLTLSPIENKIEPKLVIFILQSDDFVQHCINSIIGSTNPHVRWRDIANYEIDLPSEAVQKRIDRVLWSVESNIEKLEYLIHITEKLKKAFLNELLTKGIDNQNFKTTEIGDIPKKWKIFKLSKLFEIVGGGTPKTGQKEYWNGDIPWVTPKDIPHTDRYIMKTEKSITQAGLESSSTKILEKNSIVISARGTVGLVGQLTMPMAFNQSCYGLIASEKIDQDYLYYLMIYKVEELGHYAYGGVFNTITSKTFGYVQTALPTIQEQKRIVIILNSVFEFNMKLRKSLIAITNLRKRLTNLMLSGELSVTEGDIF